MNTTQLTGLIQTITNLVERRAAPSEITPSLVTLHDLVERLGQAMAEIQEENAKLKSRLNQPQQPTADPKATDTCKYCHQLSGVVTRIEPDPVWKEFGGEIHHYKCSNPKCGQVYERSTKE